MAPVAGPRQIYLIRYTINTNTGVPDAVSFNPSGVPAVGQEDVFVKIKEPVGDWLGMVPMPWNHPSRFSIFGPGENAAVAEHEGKKFWRRFGGYRGGSYGIVAKTQFSFAHFPKNAAGDYVQEQGSWKRLSIGFPSAYKVHWFAAFIANTPINRLGEISTIISPSGAGTPIAAVT